MIHRASRAVLSRRAQVAVLVCAASAALIAPPAAGASGSSGGAGFPQIAGPATAQPADLTVSASADGMTIAARESALLRSAFWVSGTLPAADAGRTVQVQYMGARTSWSWESATQVRVGSGGAYAASWQPSQAGQFAVRAVLEQAGAGAASNLPTITVTVYRPAVATLYGPGFYGRRTACGTMLRKTTVGVANRTLACGTPVAIYYQGQMIVVPVIDRGPYANGASWDLTIATAKALGMYTTAKVGTTSLPRS